MQEWVELFGGEQKLFGRRLADEPVEYKGGEEGKEGEEEEAGPSAPQ